MKKVKFLMILAVGTTVLSLSSCKKCHECHYDKDGQEIELGEICDKDQIKDYEANGYKVDSITYEVHCHEH
jgi:hypothetical protein